MSRFDYLFDNQPVAQEKLSQGVVRQIEDLIASQLVTPEQVRAAGLQAWKGSA